MSITAQKIQVVDLGLMAYSEAWELQQQVHNRLIENKRQGYPVSQSQFLLLCEHPPVFTLGKSGKEDHLLLNDDGLQREQIEFYRINRGGDITFHGPGQLVGYPILDLDLLFTDVHRYVRSLEEVILRVLNRYGIQGIRNSAYTGVWVNDPQASPQDRKICAIGVHLSRWVTMHGFAFNVNTDLGYFRHIVPCGIADEDKSICSLSGLLGKSVPLPDIRKAVVEEFGLVFELEPQHLPMGHLQDFLHQNLTT